MALPFLFPVYSELLARIKPYQPIANKSAYDIDIKSFHPLREACHGALKRGGEGEIRG